MPTYAIGVVRALVRRRRYLITGSAMSSASAHDLSEPDVLQCVAALTVADFHKTMPSHRFAGRMQDVYKPWFRGRRWYVKLQIVAARDADQLIIISFKDA